MRHWEKLSKPELIKACKDKGYDTGGDTDTLVARLKSRGKREPPAKPEPETE